MNPMIRFAPAVSLLAFTVVLATTAFAQSAKEVRGTTPYLEIKNEPAPKLIVDPRSAGPADTANQPTNAMRPLIGGFWQKCPVVLTMSWRSGPA